MCAKIRQLAMLDVITEQVCIQHAEGHPFALLHRIRDFSMTKPVTEKSRTNSTT